MSETEQLVSDGDVQEQVRLSDGDRDTLAGKISDSLAAAFEDEPAAPAEATPEPVAGAGEAREAVAPDGTPEVPATTGVVAPVEAADDGSPTLPEAYRRSAHARGWQDTDIDRFWKADTELALRTFDGIHQSRNAELAEFARMGRAVKGGTADATQVVAQQVSGLPQAIDVGALVAKYGNEELVTGLVGPVNEVLAAMRAVLPEIQAGVQTVRETQMDTLGKQIEGFFTASPLAPYAEVYGTVQAGLTETNKANRTKVLELADAIRAGALHQGRDMGVAEALDAAHHSVSSEFTVKTVRQQIQKTVEKRAAAVSLKPQARGAGSTGKPGDAAARLAKVTQGLAGVFGPA